MIINRWVQVFRNGFYGITHAVVETDHGNRTRCGSRCEGPGWDFIQDTPVVLDAISCSKCRAFLDLDDEPKFPEGSR